MSVKIDLVTGNKILELIEWGWKIGFTITKMEISDFTYTQLSHDKNLPQTESLINGETRVYGIPLKVIQGKDDESIKIEFTETTLTELKLDAMTKEG